LILERHLSYQRVRYFSQISSFTLTLILSQVSPTSIPLESQADHANYTVMEGTLMYMSPEQTGRMNRVVDYRSDFYSLGRQNPLFTSSLFAFPFSPLTLNQE
jgi:serine/threonine protein kinase